MQFLELDKYKKLVFQVLLVFTIAAGLVFAYINYHRQQYLLTIIETTVALISIWLLILVKNTQDRVMFMRLAMAFLMIFLCLMMFTFTIDGVSITIFIWTLAIPLVSYLLLGGKMGFVMTAIFYVISAYIFYTNFSLHPMLGDTISYANFIICALVFWGISHSYEHSNRLAKDKLNQMAVYDHLTGLFNRSMMTKIFNHAVDLSNSDQQQISLISLDLDHFKHINDQYGHATGDEVLKQFAALILENIPSSGSALRIGGEEFVIILPASNESATELLAETIRCKTKSNVKIKGLPEDFSVSVSIGVVTDKVFNTTLSRLLKTADQRMYQAKQSGRNQIMGQSSKC